MVNSRPLFDWVRLSERIFDRKMENGILETGHCRMAVQVAIKRLKVWRNLTNYLILQFFHFHNKQGRKTKSI